MKHTQSGKHGVLLVAANGATGAENGATPAKARDAERETISLDGQWQVAEGTGDAPPTEFGRAMQVPGLVSQATPAF